MTNWDKNGAKVLHEVLLDHGVEYVIGMDSPEPFYEVVAREKQKIKPILIHHEAMGALMATGYAETSFKPGICTGDVGAGSTNLVTGIAEAYKSSQPVVILSGGSPVDTEDKNPAQGIDQVTLFQSITKASIDVRDPNKIDKFVREAFKIATSGRPGPVFLNLRPEALEEGEIDYKSRPEIQFSTIPAVRVTPRQDAIDNAAKLLLSAERPCIIAGGGAMMSQCGDELIKLAELLQIPVTTTIMAKGLFPETHELSLGAIGAYITGKVGHGVISKTIVEEADVVLLIGTKTDEMSTTGWRYPKPDSKIIHIDIDPVEIGRNYDTKVAIVADAKMALISLYNTIKNSKNKGNGSSRVQKILKLEKQWEETNREGSISDRIPIRMHRLIAEIEKFVDKDTIVASDASQCSAWAASHIKAKSKNPSKSFLQPRGLGALGMAVPLSLGAQLAEPDKRVFCINGDGGFLVGQVQELETALRYELNTVTFILNNQVLGGNTIVEEMIMNNYDHEANFTNIDFAKVAEGFGCCGITVERPGEIEEAIKQALNCGKPALIDVKLGFGTKELLRDQFEVVSLGIWGGEDY